MPRRFSLAELRAAFLRRVLRRPSDYHAVCAKSWTLSPVEDRIERPAIFLGGELDRVLGVQEETTRDAELLRLAGGQRRHAETRAYMFKDARIVNGRLLAGAMSHRLSRLIPGADDQAEHRSRRAAVASTLMGSIYFGHWLHDDLSLHLAAEQLAEPVEIARQHYSHEAGYRGLLSISENRISRGRFDELILLDDWGQNADKRARYKTLRDRCKSALGSPGSERVYLRRGHSRAASGRELLNENALEAHLISTGFTVANPDTMSAGQIAAICNGSRLVVGIEGSHLAHAIFPIGDRATLVVIQPPRRFNNVFKDMTDAMDLDYAFMVGEPEADGFTVDLARLDRLLEHVAATRR